MVLKGLAQIFFVILFQVIFLLAGCSDEPKESTGITKTQKLKSIPLKNAAQYPPEDESQDDHAATDIDWGKEINLDEIILMAKSGRIVEIEWHVMPNILRSRTGDDKIFFLRNENKGVDLRNRLIKEGVKIGKEGVLFRHVF